MINLTSENFNDLINEEYVLVDFYATWCGPCKMMHPVLQNIANSRASIKIIQVDVDKFEDIARRYEVMSIPTLVLFKKGMEIDKKIGYVAEPLLIDWINNHR